jgi:SHAQKYF class myb-like DNA-binding protein
MFRISTNIERAKSKKKKFFFTSTFSSNEILSIENKNFESPNNKEQILSKSSSLNVPQISPKKTVNLFENSINDNNEKKLPMKKIFFRLCHVNYINPKKEKGKSNLQNKKDNEMKKGKFNLKHKQKHLTTKNNHSYNNNNYCTGRWKSDEHRRFIDAIIKYGNNWRQVQKYVGTRSSTQTRSHAQKFFEKLKRSKIFKNEKYDFSKNSLKILHDIMKKLPIKEYNQTLKALHSLSYEKPISENEKNNINEYLKDNCNENMENNNYDGKYIINNGEENIKRIKFINQGYCFLENNNNNKLFNNDDYLLYNNSNSCNINSNGNINCNNFLNNDYLNFDIKSYDRKESDIFSQRKNSLTEMNLNTKEIKVIKEQNNNIDDFNLNDNSDSNIYLNMQHDKNNIINKIFENNDDKIGYKQNFINSDYFYNQQMTFEKMPLEEKIMN